MSVFWRFIKRSMVGAILLWMTIDVKVSSLAGKIEEALLRKTPDQIADEQAALQQEVAALRRQNDELRRKAQGLLPAESYIVVDTNAKPNRLFMKEGQRTLLDAVCSTGKGDTLRDERGRVWVFRTPLGVRIIRRKIQDPIWTKPDWAFIEEKKPIPRDRSKRLEPDVLGDYAMDIGDGYLIHGTLYTRLLGQPVTHGCIRLGDDDLKAVFDAAQKGTRVYIF